MLRKYGIIFIFWANVGLAQVSVSIAEYRPFPEKIELLGIEPTKVGWSIANNLLLLDVNHSELIELSSFGDVTLSGGFNQRSSSFNELIWMGLSPNGIQVVDRLENKIITLDYHLNSMGESKLNRHIFPELGALDSWGRLFLYSRTYNVIFSVEQKRLIETPFIDLTKEFGKSACLKDLEVNQDGELAFLDCDGTVHIFNRLGQVQLYYPSKIDNAEFLVPVRQRWFVFNTQGEGRSIKTNETVTIPVASLPVVDIASLNRSLAILSNDHILILDVK
ncbi:MAG: hypothetical protein HOC41_09415 [Candidatus Marinimicrobia bacterium]|jgi:hypothetical protein|nr:hypothetical protein [Candidatus Neomarinimicrobiota bacterium]MBT3945647.1 hypothetical protein [Candidatus Neomarinimicrobiota bacterium]MBT4154195.1 hypothetical protein [Candidatus Neomarinimicrobiota bacterium]MBT4370692.1 hypothetical protein [Candidatus Neomarinimicrobiota bacterium]MBT4555885.1 hypothetical protein [Candidatus Neomarinimicrobiota bacterium]|tara:strand:- start:20201 stop:21031 length:831 start_codon:yes stop_codon:yes gene_type:complete